MMSHIQADRRRYINHPVYGGTQLPEVRFDHCNMKQTTRQPGSPPTIEDEPTESIADVLEALSDPDCRSILSTTVEPKTAAEIIEECDLSMSTGYRKLNQLSETPLLREQTRIDPDGGNPSEYVCTTSGLEIDIGQDGLELSIEADGEPASSEPSFVRAQVSAD